MAKKARRSEADRPIKRSRKKQSNFKLLFLFIIVVVAGGAFALHKAGKLDEVVEKGTEVAEDVGKRATKTFDKLAKNDNAKPTPATTGGDTGDNGGKGSATTAGTTRTPGKVDTAAVTRANDVITGVEKHFADGRFAEALGLLDSFIKGDPAVDSATHDRLGTWRTRAFRHHVLSKDFQRDRRLDGDTTILHMVDGSTMEVRITTRSKTHVKCVWKGINSSFPLSRVLREETLSRDKVGERDAKRFDEYLAEAKGGGPRAYLVVIKYCVERDLRPKIPYVVKTAERERKTFFSDLFETKAAILYQRYLALTRRNKERERQAVFKKILQYYPTTAIAKELGKLGSATQAPEPDAEQEQVVQKAIETKLKPKTTRVGNSRARPIVAEADQKYALAMKEYRQGFPGQPKADMHMKKAWNLFKAAQKLYEQAYKIEPSSSIEDRIAICQREIYSCQKQAKIR